MKKLFLPENLEKIAFEKGFKEPILKRNAIFYYPNTNFVFSNGGILYQQIFDWFRIEHNLVLDVFQEFNGVDAYTGFWEVDVSELKNYKQPHKLVIEEVFEDYYEALNKAIEESLKLI
jgi:hypothetical protein